MTASVMERITFSRAGNSIRHFHGFDPVTRTPIVIAVVAPEQSIQVPPATKWQAITTGAVVAEGENVDECLAQLCGWFEKEGFVQR